MSTDTIIFLSFYSSQRALASFGLTSIIRGRLFSLMKRMRLHFTLAQQLTQPTNDGNISAVKISSSNWLLYLCMNGNLDPVSAMNMPRRKSKILKVEENLILRIWTHRQRYLFCRVFTSNCTSQKTWTRRTAKRIKVYCSSVNNPRE